MEIVMLAIVVLGSCHAGNCCMENCRLGSFRITQLRILDDESRVLPFLIVVGVAVVGGEFLFARSPRQLARHPDRKIEERPRLDYHVVDVDKEAHSQHAVAKALKERDHTAEHLKKQEPNSLVTSCDGAKERQRYD
jgi:hypothetical protein